MATTSGGAAPASAPPSRPSRPVLASAVMIAANECYARQAEDTKLPPKVHALSAERCSGMQRGKRDAAANSGGSSGGTGSACASLSAAAASSDAAFDAASSLYRVFCISYQQRTTRAFGPGGAQRGSARGYDGIRLSAERCASWLQRQQRRQSGKEAARGVLAVRCGRGAVCEVGRERVAQRFAGCGERCCQC